MGEENQLLGSPRNGVKWKNRSLKDFHLWVSDWGVEFRFSSPIQYLMKQDVWSKIVVYAMSPVSNATPWAILNVMIVNHMFCLSWTDSCIFSPHSLNSWGHVVLGDDGVYAEWVRWSSRKVWGWAGIWTWVYPASQCWYHVKLRFRRPGLKLLLGKALSKVCTSVRARFPDTFFWCPKLWKSHSFQYFFYFLFLVKTNIFLTSFSVWNRAEWF